MEYPLSITSIVETDHEGRQLRSKVTHVMATADLGPFASFGFPAFFFGKLVDVSEEQILYFKHAPGVDVIFRGGGYKFEDLEKNGVFKLVKIS
ncbi:hypothetical protein [Granulicella arctica]|uniref:hypothetical protein n=1 Tax=Granulicella arctica TaxID=940613 RepID=UPI0021E058C9|nr:hypothetical protein [Granulicella arctica]